MPAKWQTWFPFRIDAFRGSPAVQAMHPAARSGYLYLLACSWQTDDCTIPTDPLELAEISGLGDELWGAHGARILRKFDLIGDRLRNAALYLDWLEAKRIFDSRQNAAGKTNAGRANRGDRTVTVLKGDGHRAQTEAVSARGPLRSLDTRTGTGTGTEEPSDANASSLHRSADGESRFVQVVEIWNQAATDKLPKAKLTAKRRVVIKARLKESGWLEDFNVACRYLAESPWHCGANDRAWIADLDFALQPGRATRLAERAGQAAPINSSTNQDWMGDFLASEVA